MVKKILKRIKYIYYMKIKKDPVLFAKKQGTKIGEGVEIYSSVNFGSEPYLISIGNHVRINDGVQLITHDGGAWVIRNLDERMKNIDLFGMIVIGDNVHIGTNATIMPGVKIGNNCIIGCGAIVTKDVPDNCIAAGVPARIIESIDEYMQKHMDEFDFTKSYSYDEKKTYLEEKYNLWK